MQKNRTAHAQRFVPVRLKNESPRSFPENPYYPSKIGRQPRKFTIRPSIYRFRTPIHPSPLIRSDSFFSRNEWRRRLVFPSFPPLDLLFD
jgi:hypothetical protein